MPDLSTIVKTTTATDADHTFTAGTHTAHITAIGAAATLDDGDGTAVTIPQNATVTIAHGQLGGHTVTVANTVHIVEELREA